MISHLEGNVNCSLENVIGTSVSGCLMRDSKFIVEFNYNIVTYITTSPTNLTLFLGIKLDHDLFHDLKRQLMRGSSPI